MTMTNSSSRRGRDLLRFVGITAGGLGCLLPTLFVGAGLTFAGARFGWVPAALLLGGAGAGLTSATAPHSWTVWRRRLIAAAGLGAALIGIEAAHTAPPSHGRLRHELAPLVPDDWALVHEVRSGNTLCLDQCPSIGRTYDATTDIDATMRAVRASAPGAACAAEGVERTCAVERGDLEVWFRIGPAPGGGSVVDVSARS
jgi:hypothetical protein